MYPFNTIGVKIFWEMSTGKKEYTRIFVPSFINQIFLSDEVIIIDGIKSL